MRTLALSRPTEPSHHMYMDLAKMLMQDVKHSLQACHAVKRSA